MRKEKEKTFFYFIFKLYMRGRGEEILTTRTSANLTCGAMVSRVRIFKEGPLVTHNRGKMPLFCRVITGKSKELKGERELKS